MREGMKGDKGFNDNRKVKDDHQEGISRVMQRKSEKDPSTRPCSGKMGKGEHNESNWNRDSGGTPKKA